MGKIPSVWSLSVIQPIPKTGGDPFNPADYRGISLQSIVMKVFLLNLMIYSQKSKMVFAKVAVIRTISFMLNTVLDGRKTLRQSTFACFIDFRKAFDSVNRALLWHKMQFQFGVQGQFLSTVKALYENVTSSVKINNQFSEWFEVNSGVKQGCVLSPTLFALFINDLVDSVRNAGKGVKNC